ncbi:MAG: dihydroneopterin aldolase [Candidatus Bipolaricaulis sp.]|nr:dihydroneopterin aldolase [Candidatus Bipolaricaulis sp.]
MSAAVRQEPRPDRAAPCEASFAVHGDTPGERDSSPRRGAGAEDVVLAVGGIEVRGLHGVHPQERETGNRFSVDVEMRGSFERAAETDELADTVDYDAVAQSVREVNRRQTYRLIESFAGAIANELLDRFERIREVRIRVRKLSVENLGPSAWTMVELSRRRA